MIDPGAFRGALGRFASGVTVVTLRNRDGGDEGITVSAFSSVSLEPPQVMVCIGCESRFHRHLGDATTLGISVLSDGQEIMSRRFADPAVAPFAHTEIERGATGVALIEGALVHLECTIVGRHLAGDHTVVIARVEHAEVHEGKPLLYYRGGYARLER